MPTTIMARKDVAGSLYKLAVDIYSCICIIIRMAQITLYIPDENEALVKRAVILLRTDKDSLSQHLVNRCKEIVKKYDKTDVEGE